MRFKNVFNSILNYLSIESINKFKSLKTENIPMYGVILLRYVIFNIYII